MLPAASLRQPDSFLKIPVSGDEYFLVENRHRDPDRNGVTLTIQRPDGTLAEQTFTKDDISFTGCQKNFESALLLRDRNDIMCSQTFSNDDSSYRYQESE